MIVKATKTIECEWCRKAVVLREYYGLEDAWYSDHMCDPMDVAAHEHDRMSDEGCPNHVGLTRPSSPCGRMTCPHCQQPTWRLYNLNGFAYCCVCGGKL